MSRDLNPGLRVDTSRTGNVVRVNPAFITSVLQRVNMGRTDYDALELHVDKRFSRNFSAKVSYTLSYSRGNTSGNGIPQSCRCSCSTISGWTRTRVRPTSIGATTSS